MTIRPIAFAAALAGGLGLAAGLGGGATAQTIALGTTQGGATEQIANAIAMVVTENTPLQVRPQIMANTAQYIPLVNDGRIELGIANFPQTYHALNGIGMSEGRPNENMRIIGSLFPFSAGLLVPEATGMTGYADLAGMRVPRFPDNSLGEFIIRTGLAAGGLTYDDVTSVPIANFPRMHEAMRAGQTDVAIATAGSQPTFEHEAALGAVRFLSFDMDMADVVGETLQGTFLRTMPEDFHEMPGMSPDTVLFAYDYMFFAHKDVPDEVIDHVVRAMHAGTEALQGTSPLWAEYNPDDLAKANPMPWHDGAIAAYRDLGIWPDDASN